MIDLESIKALLAEATPHPLTFEPGSHGRWRITVTVDGHTAEIAHGNDYHHEDGPLFAKAREIIAGLVAEVERLRAGQFTQAELTVIADAFRRLGEPKDNSSAAEWCDLFHAVARKAAHGATSTDPFTSNDEIQRLRAELAWMRLEDSETLEAFERSRLATRKDPDSAESAAARAALNELLESRGRRWDHGTPFATMAWRALAEVLDEDARNMTPEQRAAALERTKELLRARLAAKRSGSVMVDAGVISDEDMAAERVKLVPCEEYTP